MDYKVKQLIADIKSLFVKAEAARKDMAALVSNQNDIIGTFSQVTFSETAALSYASNLVSLDEDYLDNEFSKLSSDDIKAYASEQVERLTELLMARISLKMTESNIQEINGIKIVLEIWRKMR